MRDNETRFTRALAEAAAEHGRTPTTEDIAILRAELWHTYPENTLTRPYDVEDHALREGAFHFHPEYGHH